MILSKSKSKIIKRNAVIIDEAFTIPVTKEQTADDSDDMDNR